MRKRVHLSFAFGLLLFGGNLLAQDPSLEYEVKAAFLNNFVNFIDWPARTFSGPAAPVRLCVFGRDPFGGALERMARAESIGGRPRVVETTDSIDELRACHVVFIPNTEQSRSAGVLDSLGTTAVLTVGESATFLESGGIINFAIERNRVRFDINLPRAEESDLKISSKLLRLARTTRTVQARD